MATRGLGPQPVKLSLKSMLDAYEAVTYKLPVRAFSQLVDAADKLSTRSWMRTGSVAFITLPFSIILRHAASAAKMFDKTPGVVFRNIGSIAGGAAGWVVAGKALAGALATTSVMAGAPAVMAYAIAAAATFPVFMPCAALAVVAIKATALAGGFAFGHVPAIVNIPVGIERAQDRRKGVHSTYGETFSDGMPLFAAPPQDSPAASPVVEMKPVTPDFNAEAATKLDGDLTYKKIKLKVKAPAA